MANSEHLAILKQGVEVWNEWKSRTTEWADLSGADLDHVEVGGANFVRANFNGADLSKANFSGADLSFANLIEANFSYANFSYANLSGADLSNANLSLATFYYTNCSRACLNFASLRYANLSGTILTETDLTNVSLVDTALTNLDLSTTKGLTTIRHIGPCSIGIDTLYKSKGQIPEIFLRGCGVPDSFIMQAKALIGAEEGIQFYSCFISYSTLDDEFARRLHARLQQEHIRVWFAPHDMKSGEKIHEQIDEAIKVYDKLLILLSPDSLQSNWVMTELRKARKAERKTGKRKLFPMRLVDYTTLTGWECFDSDTGTDLAVEVREYFIPDFSHWKDHDAFELAFARLLNDLRQNTETAPSLQPAVDPRGG